MNELIKILKALTPGYSSYPILDGVEIKKIKEFRGHDGMPLLQGELFYEGKLIAYISEDGRGGEFNIQTLMDTQTILNKIINRYNETEVLYTTELFNEPMVIDFYSYLNDYLIASELYGKVSRARKKTFFYNPDEKCIYERNSAYSLDAEKAILSQFPKAIVFKK